MLGAPKPPKSKKKNREQSYRKRKFLQSLSEELNDDEVFGCEACNLEHQEGKRSRPHPGCLTHIDPAHRHERKDYYSQPEKLWIKNQVAYVGRWHHNKMDLDKEYRESVFQKLRGSDELEV